MQSLRDPLWELEWRWRIPRKSDHKSWRVLSEKVAADARRAWPRRAGVGLAKLDKIDRMIGTTSREKESAKKARQLRVLKSERGREVDDYG